MKFGFQTSSEVALLASGRLTWNLLLALAFAASLAYVLFNPFSTSINSALYLQAGEMLLEGQIPYVDFVDVNPPLIIYFSALWAGAAKLFGVHPIPTFLLGVWFLSVFSVLGTREILRPAFATDEGHHADLLALALALALLQAAIDGMGHGEHLFMIAFLPYLAIRFRRWNHGLTSIRFPAVVGLLAGIAACLKPHFLAIILAPELYWLVRRRRVRPLFAPETFALAAAGVGYAVHFLLLPDVMRTEFFNRWVPLIATGYWVFDRPLSVILQINGLWLGPAVCMAVAVLVLNPQRTSAPWQFAQTLAVVALMGSVLVFAQHKGWEYHTIPVRFALLGMIGLLVAEMGRSPLGFTKLRAPLNATLNLVLGALLLATAVTVGVFGIRAWSGAPLARIVASSWFAREIIENTAPGDRILFISTSPIYAYPLLTQLDRRPASKFLWFFPIPMLYANVERAPSGFPYRTGDAQPEEERRILKELSSDIARNKPVIVLIDSGGCEGCPSGFSLLDYLMVEGIFKDVLSDYEVQKRWRDWVIFQRK